MTKLAVHSPLLIGAFVTEAFGKRVVVDLQLRDLRAAEGAESGESPHRDPGSRRTGAGLKAHLVVLVGGDRHERRLREREGLEDAPADAEEVVGLDEVETRMVAMHRVQDDL